jgi:hypothetical protein
MPRRLFCFRQESEKRKKEETRKAQVRRKKEEGLRAKRARRQKDEGRSKKRALRTTDFGEKPPSRKVTARQGASEISLVD